MFTRNIYTPLTLLFLLSVCYAIFSYGLTAPNLVLLSWQPYWSFQTWIWETLFNNRTLLTQVYTLIICLFFIIYGWALVAVIKNRATLKKWSKLKIISLFTIITIPFIIASNALSYDVFNYIFNAKMVVEYQTNPHQAVALDFQSDPWLRFMHNTHTPAPYGYGWTVLSLLPFVFGLNKFLLIWINFKLFSWLSYILLAALYIWFLKKEWWRATGVLIHPLILIEVIGNSHNDLWMLVPALCSLLLLAKAKKMQSATVILSALLLTSSISIKLATIVLIPVWLALVLKNVAFPDILEKLKKLVVHNWPLLTSIALFVPLVLERSKWFLPWYITWSLVWLPLLTSSEEKNKNLALLKRAWASTVLGFSSSSLYRYLPYLFAGNYDGSVVAQQIQITWIGGAVISLLIFIVLSRFKGAR